jgi:hypothetical protein
VNTGGKKDSIRKGRKGGRGLRMRVKEPKLA